MKLGGTFYLKIQGEPLLAVGDGEFSFNLGLPKRTAEKSGSTTIGFSEESTTPYCEGEVFLTADLDIPSLFKQTDLTVTLELFSGRIYRLSGAWLVAGDTSDITTKGRVKLRFEGLRATID